MVTPRRIYDLFRHRRTDLVFALLGITLDGILLVAGMVLSFALIHAPPTTDSALITTGVLTVIAMAAYRFWVRVCTNPHLAALSAP